MQLDHDPARLGFQPVALPLQGDDRRRRPRRCAEARSRRTTRRRRSREHSALWRPRRPAAGRRPRPPRQQARRSSTAWRGSAPRRAVYDVDVGNKPTRFGLSWNAERPGRADERLPRLDRLRPTRPRWAPGPRSTRPPQVIAVSGDGGFGEYLAELTTAVERAIDITHVSLDSGAARQDSKGRRACEWPSGRPRFVTPTSAGTPRSRRPAACRSPTPHSSTTRSRAASPTPARRLICTSPTQNSSVRPSQRRHTWRRPPYRARRPGPARRWSPVPRQRAR